jgi:hypothetical protein
VELQLQAAVEIDPQGPVIRFTRWVFHGAATDDAARCWKSDQISLIRASTMLAIREIRVKFFFYLTGVSARSGPHRLVRGSHARRPFSHQFSPFFAKTDAQILRTYGAEAIQTITGSAGLGFAEDVFGFRSFRILGAAGLRWVGGMTT